MHPTHLPSLRGIVQHWHCAGRALDLDVDDADDGLVTAHFLWRRMTHGLNVGCDGLLVGSQERPILIDFARGVLTPLNDNVGEGPALL
jgi:hypothetical protein